MSHSTETMAFVNGKNIDTVTFVMPCFKMSKILFAHCYTEKVNNNSEWAKSIASMLIRGITPGLFRRRLNKK